MLKFSKIAFSIILAQNVFAEKDPYLLAPGKNREIVIQNCVACHSERLILQNHMKRKQWDEKISWMQSTQNLWPLAKDVRSKILDYLETTQGVLSSEETKNTMDELGPKRTNPLLFEKKSGL